MVTMDTGATTVDQELNALQEERIDLASKMKELASRSPKEMVPEDIESWNQMESRYDTVVERMEGLQHQAHREAVLAKLESQRDEEEFDRSTEVRESRDDRRRIPNESERCLAMQGWLRSAHELDVTGAQQRSMQKCSLPTGKRFDAYAQPYSWRHGAQVWATAGGRSRTIANRELRDLSVGTPAAGGYTVPQGFVNELEITMLAFGGLRRICQIMSTATGNDMPWPTMDDTGNIGEWQTEGTDNPTSVDPTFGQVLFKAFKASSKPVLASAELLEDSAFNLAAVLGAALGERIGRLVAQAVGNDGNGTTQPLAISDDTCSTLGKTTAGGQVDSLLAEDLIDLQDSLDPAYENFPSIAWAFRKSTLSAIRKIRSDSGAGAGTGDFLWQPGLRAGEPDMLLGAPYAVIQEIPALAATNPTVYYGAWEKYVIRDAGAFRFYRLEEKYRNTDQTGFLSFSRHDGRGIQPAAIRRLEMAAV